MPETALCRGLFGSGLVHESDGTPLRPGGVALTELLVARAGFGPGDVVLDIGCGQGAGTGRLVARGVRAIGLDTSAAALWVARERAPDARFVAGAGALLPLRAGSVDGVIAECSLSVVGERRRALAEWSRVLKPGGRLAVSDVYRRTAPGEPGEERGDGVASWQTIDREVCAAGFTVLQFEDRSEVLKEWVARFIFAYGSLDPLWGEACGRGRFAGRRAALGYYLMLAGKPVTGEPVRRKRS